MHVLNRLFLFACLNAAGVAAAESDGFSQQLPLADEQSLLFSELPSVFSASRHEQPVTRAPAAVDIVTAKQIKTYGWRTMGAILSSLPGFLSTYDRAYQHVGVRGFSPPGDYNTRILVLIDGHRVNESLQDYAGLGRDFLLDVENIERVEVVRGPASSLYGSSAFLAVVNVITQRGRDVKGAKFAGEMASYDSHRGQVSVGDKFANGLETLLTASYYHSDGQENLDYPGLGTAHNLDGEQVERLFNKTSWGDFTLSGGFMQRKKNFPTGNVRANFYEPGTYYHDRRAYADLNYRHYFANDWDATARLFWDSYEFDDDLNGRYGGQLITNRDLWQGQWFGAEGLLSHTFFDHHRVTLGSEYRRNYLQAMDNHDEAPYVEYANNRLHSSVYGVFVQDEWQILDNLQLTAGIRYDRYETFGDTVNPRLGLIVEPWQNTTWKLLYGTAFRAPNAFESFYTCCGGAWTGNSHLEPEEIESYELVWEQRLNKYADLRFSPFYNRLTNLISFVNSPVQHFVNGGNAEAHGLEALLQARYEGYEGRLSYTYLQSKIGSVDPCPNTPTHMVKLNLSAPLVADKLFAGLELQYVSQRDTVAASARGMGYSVTNLTLSSRRWLPGVEVIGGVYNLFDEAYLDPASPNPRNPLIPQDGRNFRLRASYEF